jgi:hypothetical protein
MQSIERRLLNPTIKTWMSHHYSIRVVFWGHDGFVIVGDTQDEVDKAVRSMQRAVDKECANLCINTKLKAKPLVDEDYPEIDIMRKAKQKYEEQQVNDSVVYDNAAHQDTDSKLNEMESNMIPDAQIPERINAPEPFKYDDVQERELQDMIDYELAIHGDLDTSTEESQLREIQALSLYIRESQTQDVPDDTEKIICD